MVSGRGAGTDSSTDVQSWSEGWGNDLPSFCGPPNAPYETLNVLHMAVPGTNLSWPCRWVPAWCWLVLAWSCCL